MIKQHKIGMTCRNNKLCDIINVHEGVSWCAAKHHYEVYDKNHHYDLVFYTANKGLYIKQDCK